MSERERFFQDHLLYTRDLKIWLIAYGVGAPALFLSQSKIYEKVLTSEFGSTVVSFFLFGVGLQILESIINKWMSWHEYSSLTDNEEKSVFAEVWFDSPWLRLVLDIGSMVSLLVATFITFNVLM